MDKTEQMTGMIWNKMTYTKKEKNRISIIVFAFFILRFINCFIPVSTAYVLLMTVVEASALAFYANEYGCRCSIKLLISVSAMIAFEVISWIAFGNNHLVDLFNTLLGLCLGYYMAKIGIIKKSTVCLFVIVVGTIALRLFVTGSVNDIFFRASRNNISVFFILVAVLFYSTYQRSERVSLIPAILTFVFSCIGEGRGGVVTSFILLAGIIVYNLFSKKKPTVFQLTVAVSAVVFLMFLIANYYDFFFSRAVDRLYSQNLLENERNSIIESYFINIKLNPIYLLFGVPSNNIPVVEYLNGNFHNSFLALHSNFGLIGFIIILILIVMAIRKSVMNSCWLYLLLLLVICLRIFTDGLCFVGLYDPLIYYLLFLCILGDGKECEKQNENY